VNFYPSHPSRPYRYVRFVPRDGWRAEVAELAFYENLHDDVAISSKAILSCPPVDGNPAHAMDKANDGDWLTFFFSEEANGTVTLGSGKYCLFPVMTIILLRPVIAMNFFIKMV